MTDCVEGALGRVCREIMLRNAHRLTRHKYRGIPVWAFVSDVCGVGSTSAMEICKEIGWGPESSGGKRLRRNVRTSEKEV